MGSSVASLGTHNQRLWRSSNYHLERFMLCMEKFNSFYELGKLIDFVDGGLARLIVILERAKFIFGEIV